MKKGIYFYKKEYHDTKLLTYEEVQENLPKPILAYREDWVKVYDYAVKVLFDNQHYPEFQSGFVSNFVDAAFNENIFLWDTAFMTLFCNLLHPYVPGIRSLDNFYAKQFDDGEIPREIVRKTGEDYIPWVNTLRKPLYSYFHNHYGHRSLKGHKPITYETMYKPDLGREVRSVPYLTLDNLNHPIMAFAEWESYIQTGDKDRLEKVVDPLYRYYGALKEHLKHQNGLFITDWASMDNSPRNDYLGCAIDTSCEMVLFGKRLLAIIEEIEKQNPNSTYSDIKREITVDVEKLSQRINEKMWDEKSGFYYDITFDGNLAEVKTIAGFWPLISGVADKRKAEKLVEWLKDEKTFNRIHRVPSLAANEKGYDPDGGYWRGSVWAPTNAMVVLGLEKAGYHNLAKEIAENHLYAVAKVFKDTGTIWENYPADSLTSGNADKKDFVGWSGIGPIYFLLRYVVGLNPNSNGKFLDWEIAEEHIKKGEIGCENYWFQGVTLTIKAHLDNGKVCISGKTDAPLKLEVRYRNKKYEYHIAGTFSAILGEKYEEL